ncbi:class I SAM-dependent methyltransferase [Rhodoblastus sp.]|uniref:class I SAM-dependent methyltransferase n=1 Tax=Rhodoblastus sp. TaxID=1962975 RepID=UPI003F99C8C9
MTTPPLIFDRALWRKRLARAARAQEPCDFLAARVAEDLAFRLAPISRPFSRALDLGSPHPAISQALAAPGRLVLRAAPVVELASDATPSLVADEEALPFAPQSFDLVVSALSLQFANDLPGVFAQVRRILAPDGLFLAAAIGGQTLSELRFCLAQAQDEIEGGASPRVAPFADLRDLGGLLQRAGFALPVSDCDAFTVRYSSAFGLMRDLRAMGATNVLAAGARRPLRRDVALRAAALYAEKYSDPDGRIRATFEIVWASGWAPHQSQQKPLRPGSARMPLSAVLGDKSRDA